MHKDLPLRGRCPEGAEGAHLAQSSFAERPLPPEPVPTKDGPCSDGHTRASPETFASSLSSTSRGRCQRRRGSCSTKSYLVLAPTGPPQSLRDRSLPAYARTGSARGSKLIEGLRSAAGISLRPAPVSTLLVRPWQQVGLAARIEIPAAERGSDAVGAWLSGLIWDVGYCSASSSSSSGGKHSVWGSASGARFRFSFPRIPSGSSRKSITSFTASGPISSSSSISVPCKSVS